jgi:hypothetical protein
MTRVAPTFDNFEDAVVWGKKNFGSKYLGVTESFFTGGRVTFRPFAEQQSFEKIKPQPKLTQHSRP